MALPDTQYDVIPNTAQITYSSSNSGRLPFLKETAHSQEWLVLQATNAHQAMSRWLLLTKKKNKSSQTNRL